MHVMIIEIYNDDIDQRKCPKPIPQKSPGRFHTRIWPKIQKSRNFLNHLKCDTLPLIPLIRFVETRQAIRVADHPREQTLLDRYANPV